MNWGVIGSDLIADEFIEKLMKSGRTCYIAQCTNEELKKKYANAIYNDTIEELLKNGYIQVLYISTFVPTHKDIVMEALKYGVHVIGEKPLFMNAEDASEAYEYAAKKGLLLAEANTLFYMPIYREIKQKIAQGEIGYLKMIRCEFGSLKIENSQSPVMRKDMGGGALYDIGIYALTAVLSYLKGPVDVKILGVNHICGVDEGCSIIVKNDKDQLASILLSIRAKMDKRFIIAGDKGFFEIMNYPRADTYEFINTDMLREQHQCGYTKNAVLYEIEKIEHMIEEGNYQEAEMQLTCDVMKVMDTLRKEIEKC